MIFMTPRFQQDMQHKRELLFLCDEGVAGRNRVLLQIPSAVLSWYTRVLGCRLRKLDAKHIPTGSGQGLPSSPSRNQAGYCTPLGPEPRVRPTIIQA
jgi:hypothetical protein